ncbi:uncharacterized protein RAG0_02730 [Rhynchosporium agropyri]|uniref:Uncharacterized protein n=1 Tax=Rhynchosporium agropyri TaxID=914238 RepID=A0A1E1K6R9_9HELO|nr:uncharacterized protein RAG0_02730 [Rhynchosporium agropyri]
MSTGVPAFTRVTRSTFSYDKSPTLFHPASSKMEPAKPPVVDSDNSSIATTSTFSSKVELLKESVKSKIPATYRDFRSRKKSAAGSVVASKGEKRLPPDTKTPMQRTAEAYMIWASLR